MLKSVLQKRIRRGDVRQAAAAAREIEARDPDTLARRLTIITVEDVDWRLMPAVGLACQAAMTDSILDGPQPSMVEVAASLAASPKNKEAWWMAAGVWAGRYPVRVEELTPEQVVGALEAGDHRRLFALLHEASSHKLLRGRDGLLVGFRNHLAKRIEPAALEIVDWCLWREKLGGFGWAECLAGACIAAIDNPTRKPRLEDVWAMTEPLVYPWFAFDGHTRIGKIVAGNIAKRRSLDRVLLGNLQFMYESIIVSPEAEARWKQETFDRLAVEDGYVSVERGAQMWQEIRGDVLGLTEWIMRKEGLVG